MRAKSRPVGIAVATATLLLSTSLSLGGAAFATTGSGDAGTTDKINSTATGVGVSSTTPSGAVIVVLQDQLANTPANASQSANRKTAATKLQDQVLAAAGITSKNVKHFALVNGFATTITPLQSKALAADPRVKSIVPDVQTQTVTPAPVTAGSATAKTQKLNKSAKAAKPDAAAASSDICPANPKKPLLEPEAITVIKAASATGGDSAQKYATGKGVKVAVMAEGIDPNAPDYKRADGTSAIVDYKNFSGAPEASVQYGDEIFGDASSIAAQGKVVHDLSSYVNIAHALPEGCNIQIKGVSPDASVVALNVLGGGDDASTSPSYAFASNIVQAIDYAVTVQHVDILSESIGASQIPDQSSRNAVQQFNDAAVAQGVTVFAATGDAGLTSTMGSPAIDPLVIGVGATTTLRAYQQVGYTGTLLSKDHKWLNGNIGSFSSGGFGQAGNLPVIVAPGDAGWAACTDKRDRPGCTDFSGNASDIELFGGSSQSTPFTAGVAALVIQAYKDGHQGIAPSPVQVRQILTGTATDLGAPGQQQGVGQVDALAAVKLAKTFGNSSGAAVNAVTVNQDQLQATGAAGQAVSQTVTVNNASNKAVTLKPSVKSLVSMGAPISSSTTLAENGPKFLGPTGAPTTYKTVTFKVPANVDQYTFQFTYGLKGTEQAEMATSSVNMSLISPSGQYVGNTRPQNGTSYLGPSQYGRFDVVHPAAGTWTAVFSSGISSQVNASTGTPSPTAPYSGAIAYKATMNHWVESGSVSAKNVSVKAHSSAAFTVNTTMPKAAGDSSLTVFLGAPAAYTAPTIPISQRVLVALNAKGGSFSGVMTGGNGRGNAPASQDTFAMNVPAGQRSLQVKVGFGSQYKAEGIRVGLIDPNGVPQSLQSNNSNVVLAATDSVSSAYLTASNPIPGQWRVVVWQLVTTLDRQITTPYTGTVTFNDSGVSSDQFMQMGTDKSALTSLPIGQQSQKTITITNHTDLPASYVIDPRTASLVAVKYPSSTTSMPSAILDVFGTVMVPAQTQRIDATVTAPIAVQAQLAGPGIFPVLAGVSSVGNAAQPVNGVATSTATLSTRSGALSVGVYGTEAGSVGPFGAEGAPHATATVNPTIYTAGFDTSATTKYGDLYAISALGLKTPPDPISVDPGKSVDVTVNISPQGAVGSTVTGRINVLQVGYTGQYAVISPYMLSSDQVVEAFDYRYKVSAGTPQFSGKVTGLKNAGLPGVSVEAYDADSNLIQTQKTAADGSYVLGGLTVGQPYRVCFDPITSTQTDSYTPQCYKGQAWNGLGSVPWESQVLTAPAAGKMMSGIDAALDPASTITGVIKDPQGNPVDSALVFHTDANGDTVTDHVFSTDADGKYIITGLTKDTKICVWTGLATIPAADPNGLVNACGTTPWGIDKTWSPAAGAKSVAIEPGKTVNYDVTLAAGAAVSGTVKSPAGAPAPRIHMDSYSADGLQYGNPMTLSDDNGNFTITGLPQVPVAVCGSAWGGTDETCGPNVAFKGQGNPVSAGTTLVTAPPMGVLPGQILTLLPQSFNNNIPTTTQKASTSDFTKLLQKIVAEAKASKN